MVKYKIEGINELQRSLKKLGDVPQRSVTKAAKKGMNIALKSARKNAPEDSGELKGGIISVGEKSRLKGKKVYQVVFDRNKNDIFQKPIKYPKKGKNKIAYYPASQEFGYFLRNGKYMPGLHFMKKALQENETAIRKKIVDEMSKEIDKALRG